MLMVDVVGFGSRTGGRPFEPNDSYRPGMARHQTDIKQLISILIICRETTDSVPETPPLHRHVWMAPDWQGFFCFPACAVTCSHVSGL
jgi:hypothetical protein